MIEYFDIVDEQDHPTGQKTYYKEAHSNGVLHRCVAVFVFDSKGQLYVQQRPGAKGHLDHTVGGHVSAGEDYLPAAIRESEEEVGLTEELTPVLTSLYSDETYNPALNIRHMFGIYECRPSPAWHFEPNDEVPAIFPQPLATIAQQMMDQPGRFAPGFINTMEAYIKHKGLDIKFDAQKCRDNWKEV